MCKVSVIVPVYNSEEYLSDCLASLAIQTLDDIEIIVVNDGSTDGSQMIAEMYSSNYSHFSVHFIKNSGVSHARNFGASLSRGDYLAFVDSDDCVEPDYCKTMFEKAIRDGNDLVVCQFDKVTISDKQAVHIVSQDSFFDIDNFKMSEKRQHLPSVNVGPWNKLVKRTLFEKIQFPEGIRYAEDRLFSLEAFCLAEKIGTIKRVLYHYYYEFHGGITSGFGEERLDWLLVMEQLYCFMRSENINDIFDNELEYIILSKSISLCTAAIARTKSDVIIRRKLIKGVFAFLQEKLPDWRNNPIYINKVNEMAQLFPKTDYCYYSGKKVRRWFCDYGESHFLLLINMSSLLPKGPFEAILTIDGTLFSTFRYVRWKLMKEH